MRQCVSPEEMIALKNCDEACLGGGMGSHDNPPLIHATPALFDDKNDVG